MGGSLESVVGDVMVVATMDDLSRGPFFRFDALVRIRGADHRKMGRRSVESAGRVRFRSTDEAPARACARAPTSVVWTGRANQMDQLQHALGSTIATTTCQLGRDVLVHDRSRAVPYEYTLSCSSSSTEAHSFSLAPDRPDWYRTTEYFHIRCPIFAPLGAPDRLPNDSIAEDDEMSE